jgi:hypothetical protein
MKQSQIAAQILAETGNAYLVVDSTYQILEIGGNADALQLDATLIGESLFRIFPELIGSEDVLQAILAGRTPRLHLPQVKSRRG